MTSDYQRKESEDPPNSTKDPLETTLSDELGDLLGGISSSSSTSFRTSRVTPSTKWSNSSTFGEGQSELESDQKQLLEASTSDSTGEKTPREQFPVSLPDYLERTLPQEEPSSTAFRSQDVTNAEGYGEEGSDKIKTPAVNNPPLNAKDAGANSAITVPGEYDVLFGRGKASQEHPGNQYMRGLANSNREDYDKADRNNKTEISRDIVEDVQSRGGRFLKRQSSDTGDWIEVTGEIARKKVAHALRDGRSKPALQFKPDDFAMDDSEKSEEEPQTVAV